ncbi:MAG: hypothetical protein HYT71_03875 [Candidatus Aenigmarchaeota archaeon]|nr:hypothetical protein [Candidatus Aenigmarchaeota archaeon]
MIIHRDRVLAAVLLSALFLISISDLSAGYSVRKADISVDLSADSSARQIIKFYFAEPVADKSINYTLSEPAKNIEVYGDDKKLTYTTIAEGDDYNLQLFPDSPVSVLLISYTVDDIVFHSGPVNYFFTDFFFGDTLLEVNSELKLPAGYEIYQNSYRPADGAIISDGKRIILEWNETNVNGSISFSVKYANTDNGFVIWLFVSIILAVAFVFIYSISKKKTAEAFLKGFREDEKKTIAYLQGKKVGLQSDLQAEFGFSRAKSTRIVYELEKKGLLRKQRHGRTNKLFWLGE